MYPLYQTIPHLNRETTNTQLLPTKRSVVRSVSTPALHDFRFTHGKNNGFGTVYIWVTYSGPKATDYHYPDPDLALFDDERITKLEDPNYKANGIYFVRNDQGADKQFEYFVPNHSQGIT